MTNKATLSRPPVPSSTRGSSPTASMPAYAGRYRSRLFKFFSRQTRRLIDNGERATRQAQVATVWGVQVLVYPVYLLFQSARLAGKQLQQAWQRLTHSQESLNYLPSDTPIQRVLETVEELSLVTANTAKTAIPPRISSSKSKLDDSKNRQIQGIATLPEKGNLVLVDSENQTLDILTEEQQQKLQKQISLELANYCHHQRQFQHRGQPNIYLPLPEDRNTVLPPIRLFRQLMAWMQRGPIASAVNLFQEETQLLNQGVKNHELQYRAQQLKLKSQELKQRHQKLTIRAQNQFGLENETEQELPASSFIDKIDNALAKLETGSFTIAQVPSYIGLRTEEFLQLVKTRLQNSSAGQSENSQTHKLKFQVLIRAAADYFLTSKEDRKLAEQENQAIAGNSANYKILEPIDPDGWLAEEDLFYNSVPANFKRSNLNDQSSSSALFVTEKNIRSVSQVEKTSVQGKKKAASSSISQGKSVSVPPAAALPSSQNKLAGRNMDDRNSDSDWIETKATPTGYIKHPLETILEWLDRAMLFVEELMMMLWTAIGQVFK